MHGVSHQSMGSGPRVSMFEDPLAHIVSIDLRVNQNSRAAVGLGSDAMRRCPPMETGWDFSTRQVHA